jgi:group I intron endonuclease
MLIYKTTNLLNGKVYIGQSKNDNPYYLGSGKIILNAIKKHGRSNFKKEILCKNIFSYELMDELEKHYIQLFASNVKGYNILNGGRGNKPEQNNKISLNNGIKGKPRTDDVKAKLRLSQLGKTLSEETKIKIGLKSKGNKYLKDHKHSKESRFKMSEGQKKRFENNEILRLEHSQRIKNTKPYLKSMICVQVLNCLTNEEMVFKSIKELKLFFNTKNSTCFNTCIKTGRLYKKLYKLTILK